MGMTAGGFSWQIWKNDMKALSFLENRCFFWQNMDMRAGCFFRMEVLLTKYGHKSSDFFMRNRKKKGILLTFLAHNIVVLDQIWAWQQELSHEKFEKRHKSTAFLREWTFFWQNMGMRAVWFLENGRSFTEYGHETTRALIFIEKS